MFLRNLPDELMDEESEALGEQDSLSMRSSRPKQNSCSQSNIQFLAKLLLSSLDFNFSLLNLLVQLLILSNATSTHKVIGIGLLMIMLMQLNNKSGFTCLLTSLPRLPSPASSPSLPSGLVVWWPWRTVVIAQQRHNRRMKLQDHEVQHGCNAHQIYRNREPSPHALIGFTPLQAAAAVQHQSAGCCLQELLKIWPMPRGGCGPSMQVRPPARPPFRALLRPSPELRISI